uniref:Putative secreted protein n=1 Tax=Anopheles triannulatus TaxID=58253 RepID=A0A2M4B1D8_9DIPT
MLLLFCAGSVSSSLVTSIESSSLSFMLSCSRMGLAEPHEEELWCPPPPPPPPLPPPAWHLSCSLPVGPPVVLPGPPVPLTGVPVRWGGDPPPLGD